MVMKEDVIKNSRERALKALIIFFCGGLSKGFSKNLLVFSLKKIMDLMIESAP